MDFDLSSIGGGIVHSTFSFNYLAIPVHVKLKYPLPMVKLYALAGVNMGILLSAKGKGEMTGFPAVETDLKDSLSATDFGIDLGAGVEFSLPKITPFIEFVYYMGMVDIEKDPDVTDKSSGFEIRAGLKFKM
jgi:opacity protein-like surface antigen